jgi:hypothetical protein
MHTLGHGVLAVGAAVLLLGSFAHAAEPPVAAAPVSDAVAAVSADQLRASANARVAALEAASANARTAWEQSADRVLDEGARTELSTAIANAERVADEVRHRVVWPGETPEATLAADTAALEGASSSLDSGLAQVNDAVAAWEAEQARLAAEAAAEAARQAAAAAAARGGSRGGGAAPAGSGVAHIEGIWTSGGQAEIDACRGSVNVSPVASYLGAAFYAAEHWSCGGSAWGRIGVGGVVEFPGYGTYQVAGLIGGLSYGADASVLPAGYAGYYQTCIGGSSSNMTVWLLTRVG